MLFYQLLHPKSSSKICHIRSKEIEHLGSIKLPTGIPMRKSKYNKTRHSQGKKMLMNVGRKLVPLMTLAIATIGCGKKISENKSVPAQQIENQEMPSAYILRLDGSESSRKNYFLPRPAQFEVPEMLKVRKGSTLNRVVEIAFDVNQFDGDDIQFKCIYIPSSNESQMQMSKCVDYDGDDFGEISGHKFTLRFNDIIQMRFTGTPSQDLVVEAVFSMTWI